MACDLETARLVNYNSIFLSRKGHAVISMFATSAGCVDYRCFSTNYIGVGNRHANDDVD